MPEAIIFVPDIDCRRWLDVCGDYAARHGYTVVAVVSDWDDVQQLAREHSAVVIVARPEHLPPDRLPRVEVVAEERDTPIIPSARQRPQRRTPEVPQ